jgi:alkylation response protein AidB-like acyl-CoA dehydrogenase
MAAGGSDALIESAKQPRDWLRSKGNSIEGGTSEVQLNIVAKHILRLPGA